jgi:hypothetical protein
VFSGENGMFFPLLWNPNYLPILKRQTGQYIAGVLMAAVGRSLQTPVYIGLFFKYPALYCIVTIFLIFSS